jgi:hypothetical protein
MTLGDRNAVELDTPTRRTLAAAVIAEQPDFAARLPGIEAATVEQPFFARTSILDVTSPLPMPSRRLYMALTKPAEFHVLTGHIEQLNCVAAADPPEGLEDPPLAKEYMFYASAWTTVSTGRELLLNSIDDIPWWEFLDDAQKVQIEDIKQAFGPKIRPPELFMAFPNYELQQWFLVGQTLVERVLTVSMKGQFARAETVHRRGLPVPPGRIWGHKDGRFVPVG